MNDAITETHEDVQNLIRTICLKFLSAKSVPTRNWDIFFEEAEVAFVRAWSTYDPSKGRFSTWLWHSIWGRLSFVLKRESRWAEVSLVSCNLLDEIEESRPCKHVSFCSEVLSEDARSVADLVVGASGIVDGEEADVGDVRVSIYSLLTGLGWSFRRIVESFAEIRTALLD